MTTTARALLAPALAFLLCGGQAPSQLPASSAPAVPILRPELQWRSLPWLGKRIGHDLAYDPLRQVVVCFGGDTAYGDDTWEWDGRNWHRRLPPHRPGGRAGHCMAFDPVRQTVLMFGGWDKRRQRLLDDTWEWDGSDWRQLEPQQAPPPRDGARMVMDETRKQIVLFGGLPLTGRAALADTWIWDGSNWAQRFPATVPQQRHAHGMCYDPLTGRVCMFGGFWSWPYLAGNDMYEWDGRDWSRLTPATRPAACPHPVMLFDPNVNKMILLGERSGSYDTWTWDGSAWGQLNPKTVPPYHGRGWRGATDLARKQILTCGYDDGLDLDIGMQTWGFTQGDWKLLHEYSGVHDLMAKDGHPSPAVHDEARDQFVHLGLHPLDSPPQNYEYQMWVLRNETWSRLRPKALPPARAGGQLLYYKEIERVVLFGGLSPDRKQLQDIWVWDGTDWKEHPLSNAPSQPYFWDFVYDRKRRHVVRYPYDGVNWFWHHQTGWSSSPTKTQPPPNGGRLGYDWLRERIVLHHQKKVPYNGPFGFSFDWHTEVWEWDGQDWSRSFAAAPGNISTCGFSAAAGGLVFITSNSPVTLPDPPQCWVYDGTWNGMSMATRSIPMQGVPGWTLLYDANRQQLRGIHGHPGRKSYALAEHHLLARVRYPRPGEEAQLDVVYPGKQQPFLWALSTNDWPGIPLQEDPQLGTQMLPLGPSPLLDASLKAGLVQALDRDGKGLIRIPIPKSSALIGLRIFAAGVLLGSAGIDAISNAVELEIVR